MLLIPCNQKTYILSGFRINEEITFFRIMDQFSVHFKVLKGDIIYLMFFIMPLDNVPHLLLPVDSNVPVDHISHRS